MALISEWLPNPKGADAPNEWIEIFNSGNFPLDLSGWRLTADGKKFFTLKGTIDSGARLVLPRTETKVTLKNADGRLALYDSSGRLADQVSFVGTAPEGQSVNRSPYGSFFGAPTPGVANAAMGSGIIVHGNEYPFGAPLNKESPAAPGFIGSLLGAALALSAAVVFILKSHEGLSHLFLQRD